MPWRQWPRARRRGPGPSLGRRAASSAAAPRLPAGAVVFSGIQPTGAPHLGNYLGALRQWARLQDAAPPDARLLFSVVDLHAFTSPAAARRPDDEPASELLRRRRRETLAALLAVGLDPRRSTLFYQSSVRAGPGGPLRRRRPSSPLLVLARLTPSCSGPGSRGAHVAPELHFLRGLSVPDDAVEGRFFRLPRRPPARR